MITNKYINKITAVLVCLSVVFTALLIIFPNSFSNSQNTLANQLTYPQELFSDGKIMTINISVDQDTWDNMIQNATDKKYICCDVTINGTLFKSVGVRTKGNSSLKQVSSDSSRYSLKFEFDHYIKGQTCFGLDKFVVNNIQADNTYMKEYLSYAMLNYIGVESSQLCSFSSISVNDQNWGFYLAVEGIEESFATRVYGNDYGQLYKPETVRADNIKNDIPQNINPDDQNLSPEQNNTENANESTMQPPAPKDNNFTNPNNPPPTENNGNNMPPDFKQPLPQNEMQNKTDTYDQDKMPFNTPSNDNPQTEQNTKNNQENPPKTNNFMPNENPDEFDGRGADLLYSDNNISSYSDIFDNSVFKSSDNDKQRVITAIKNLNEGNELEKYINVDQVLRYFAANTVMVNLDSYICNMKHNYYLYEKNGQISIVPWDYNLSYAGFQCENSSEAVNFPINTLTASGTELSNRPLIAKLLEVDEYKQLYHNYILQIVNGFFNYENFSALIDKTDNLICEYVKNDPSSQVSFEQYKTALATLKTFSKLRCESILGQLNGSIPSTREAQNTDSSSLIDASSINISDMGSQGNGKPNNENNFLINAQNQPQPQ